MSKLDAESGQLITGGSRGIGRSDREASGRGERAWPSRTRRRPARFRVVKRLKLCGGKAGRDPSGTLPTSKLSRARSKRTVATFGRL